ncbi:unnamed protein product [Paramecium pentaurelia]|uniref:Uncharacterized protein n=1 Tax=Paramecium pentaurelia TaxID=43138 RepID=A0A8S1T718_9CILI|nr:unnamed protein product [Paramecium pentaurelia]
MKIIWLLIAIFIVANAQQDSCYEVDPKDPPRRKEKIPLIYHSGWTQELVVAKSKGNRPQPQEYMNQEYIDQHLKYFRYGASFIITTAWLDNNGREFVGNKNGIFVIPKSQMDQLLNTANGNLSIVEKNLGLNPGSWQFRRLSRIDVPFPEKFNVRMPTGNEVGANQYWRPGGVLPNGLLEAVIDMVPKSDYQEFQLNLQ